MKIALVAHNLKVAGGLSVGKNIIRTLPEIAPMHEYLIVVPEGCRYPTFENHSRVKMLQCPSMAAWKRWYWDKTTLRHTLKQFQPDWIWGLGNLGFGNFGCRQSILFHFPHLLYSGIKTANPFTLKEHIWLRFKYFYLEQRLKKDLTYLNSVYCQTEVAQERLSRIYNYPIEQIGLCPNSFSQFISTNRKDAVALPNVLSPYRERFKLFVLTRYYPHKNLERIVDMYDQYRDELSDTVCILTISPSQGLPVKNLLKKIQTKNLDSLIITVGALTQEELPAYFGNSDALFLPSLLESFSGTYLEAMVFQTPIITSDLDFAHGICGEAAFYVDPYSLEAMKNGIVKLKENPQICKQLTNTGNDWVHRFFRSWNDILKSVLDREGIEHLGLAKK